MKLNPLGRFGTNSFLRALSQRYIEAPLLRKMAAKERYPLCLEIGCGRGIGAEIIVAKFGAEKVIATDIDPEQIDRAKRHLKNKLKDRVILRVEDAMALAEWDDEFDAVFSFGVIHMTEDWRKTIREVIRVLKPGGEFFFMEMLESITRNPFLVKMFHYTGGGEFGVKELADVLGKAGLKVTGLKQIGNLFALGAARKKEGG